MRKLILVLVSASVGLILTAVVLEPRAAAVGGQGGRVVKCSAQNGDVNADGKIDLADPVTILGHLFLGSPTVLEQLCAPPPAPSGLPDTGQTKCYDASGVEIPCESASCPGQDGSYATGCPSEGRFTDNGDGTVTDHCTGLMWQQDTTDQNGDGQITVEDRIRWCDALAFCENLSFAGHDDWPCRTCGSFRASWTTGALACDAASSVMAGIAARDDGPVTSAPPSASSRPG